MHNFITGTITANCPVGSLFNFNEVLWKNGLGRVVNHLPQSRPRVLCFLCVPRVK